MNVNEAVKLSCDFLGLEEVKNVIGSSITDEGLLKQSELLLKCLNLACEEIFTQYLPNVHDETINSAEGKFYFENLSQPIYGIVSLTSLEGDTISFTQFANHIEFDAASAKIKYITFPSPLNYGDEVRSLVSERVIAYGIAREYYLFQGMSDDATMFELRFKEALIKLKPKHQARHMPARKWK